MSESITTEKEQGNPYAGKKYIRAVGRRKSASAVAKLYAGGSGEYFVNRKPLNGYFNYFTYQDQALAALVVTGTQASFDVPVNVAGGGEGAQAEATALAIARALVLHDESYKPVLRQHGLLTVDRRVKERKKPGLKRARRSPQWSKR